MEEFIYQLKRYGLKVAVDNVLISFIKWLIKAKRIKITYGKQK